MHMQAHMSGQIPGQVPSQGGLQLSGLPQLPSQLQNMGAVRSSFSMDQESLMARKQVMQRIYQILQKQQLPEWQHRLPDVVRRLEGALWRDASSKDEYLNMETLDHRLQSLIKHLTSRNQQFTHTNSSAPMGTMIPTPGLPSQSGNLNSGGNNVNVSSSYAVGPPGAYKPGNLLSSAKGTVGGIHGGSFNTNDGGAISNGYQLSASNGSVGYGGNNMMPMGGVPKLENQMIPTPGLNNFQPQPLKSEYPSSGVESNIRPSSALTQQKTFMGSNNHMLHNVGGQINLQGMRSSIMSQKPSYGFSNATSNPTMQSNMQVMNVSTSNDAFLSNSSYGNSPKFLDKPFDQQHQHRHQLLRASQQIIPLEGDAHGMNGTDVSGSGNLCSPSTSIGSAVNNPNVTPSLHSRLRPNSSLLSRQSNSQMQQSAHLNVCGDHSSKINFQSSNSSRDNLIQSQQNVQKFPQNPHPSYSQIGEQELQHQQINEQFSLPELHNQLQLNSIMNDHTRVSSSLPHPSDSQEIPSCLNSFSHNSQNLQQIIPPNQKPTSLQSELNNISTGFQPESILNGQWDSQSQGQTHLVDQNIQEKFHVPTIGQNATQQPFSSLEEPVTGQNTVSKIKNTAISQTSGRVIPGGETTRERQFLNQKRWLLFLCHAYTCQSPKGQCQEPNCITVQELLKHMQECEEVHCGYPRCRTSKVLIKHNRDCRNKECPVCIPVQMYVTRSLRARSSANSLSFSWRSVKSENASSVPSKAVSVEISDDIQPSGKRLKVEHPSPSNVPKIESSPISQPHSVQETHLLTSHEHEAHISTKSEMMAIQAIEPLSSLHESPSFCEIKREPPHDEISTKLEVKHVIPDTVAVNIDNEQMQSGKKQNKIEIKPDPTSEHITSGKTGKSKIKGVSLTELFTPEQIREHIRGLRQWVGQSKAKVERNQAMEHSMSENSCQLCAVEKLTFEPPPLYCSTCGARIKRNSMYYTVGSGETRHYFCIPCYNEARSETIEVDGLHLPKGRMEKKKNDEETEEWWVQCDKCEAWQHQICALFNGRRNDGGQAEYTCPYCYIKEIDGGERKPLPHSAVLGAKDLPRTILSDHIEQRLFRRLKQERQERARLLGKNFDEVPGAEALVVRVVSSVDKKLDVKPRFLEIFQQDNYSTEFPYKSKVILLFQKIEGVEVCLFGMYVQEFGSECELPNQRRVYLSYLDSVKYFRPDAKTVTGEALRTFVYHEILIGYLEYCKKRGFTSCYIWACPPLKGEDYILYCHPEIQKTPKSDKLREWYLSMLRKASKENIVVDLVNLYDHFFVCTGECKAKVTAARLPYFDGDYWPGAAEDMINQLRLEEEGKKLQKKGKIKKIITKRALKAAGQTDLSCNATKDALLMQKLGETIHPMKEDFIMVHLQHACTHCCVLIVSGKRWVCNQCKKFQLCDRCYAAEQKIEERDKHPINSREKHILYPVEVNDVPEDTRDTDDILESEFFDTRQAFLSLCQGNHYQYDTLRRAKHSSMMVLYHLHNPTAPAFVTTCNICRNDIEAGQGWRCETCVEYDVCNACYEKGGIDHPHKLTSPPSASERDVQNQEARQKRVLQLRKMLDLLVHAAQCRSATCLYPNCRKVKGLFRHGIQCKVRAAAGCVLCKKMWYLLQLHSRACKESQCIVPRCRDLKEHMRRLQQQSDSRRRAAVMEMMRKRAAEIAGNSG